MKKIIILKTAGIFIITAILILSISSVKTLAASDEDGPYFANITIDKDGLAVDGLVVGDGDEIHVTCELLNSLVFPESCSAIIDIGNNNVIEFALTYNEGSEKYEGTCKFRGPDDNPAGACYIKTIIAGDIVSNVHINFESPEFYYCNTCKSGTHFPEVAHESVNPTCTSPGNTEEIKCSLCGAVISELKTIPATGHAYGDWSITKEPTCTEKGTKKKICSACGDTVVETIPMLDHKWNTTCTIDVPATVSAPGSQSIHCSVCGTVKEGSSQVIPQLAPAEVVILAKPRILKPTAGKNKITVKWKKISGKQQKRISKIQIQYSMDRGFKTGVMTVTANKRTTSKIINKLNSKKRYYVRIRAYKESGEEVHVSLWSTVKKVKVK